MPSAEMRSVFFIMGLERMTYATTGPKIARHPRLNLSLFSGFLPTRQTSTIKTNSETIVSLAAWRRGRLGKSELLTYMAAQLIGAILAALFTQVVQGAVIEEFAKAAVATAMKGGPAPKLSSIFIAEFAWTSVLAYVLLQVSTTKRAESPVVFGLIIGLTLTTGGIALASVSGGVVNPALFVALCILGVKNWSSILVFLGAQCLGALVAGELFRRTNPDEAA